MKYGILGVVLFAAGAAAGIQWKRAAQPEPVHAAALPVSETKLVVAAGRVEPVTEEIKIGSELDGRLKTVAVEEGQRVARGQVIAELENGDYRARVELAKATLEQRQAILEKLRNGSRVEERRQAEAEVHEAEALLDNATIERNRRQNLLDKGAVSRTEFDSADREWRVAKAKLDAMRQRAAIVQDETRPEDLERAEAEVEQARAQVAEAQALVSKTLIRTPVSGVILRKKLKAGESVSKTGDQPIVTLGDTSRLRVRVDVDENDVAKLREGQTAYVTAAAYGDHRFTGKVVRIGQILGRKNVRTDEPSERVDTKILETLVELDEGQTLPVGLRVDAYIDTAAQ